VPKELCLWCGKIKGSLEMTAISSEPGLEKGYEGSAGEIQKQGVKTEGASNILRLRGNALITISCNPHGQVW